ncbi:hypothetical protein PINS_up009342 [Pythium insidiosum]|nr:hypothetical protein PINS_up009342 [Pythium insidiosum]
MGNFASSPEWIHDGESGALPMPTPINPSTPQSQSRPCVTPMPFFSLALCDVEPQDAVEAAPTDLVTHLITTAIDTCKRSIHSVFTSATQAFDRDAPAIFQTFSSEECDEWSRLNDVMLEFHATYAPGYKRSPQSKSAEIQMMTPQDVHVIDISGTGEDDTKKRCDLDDGTSSWTTEETEDWSESESESDDEEPSVNDVDDSLYNEFRHGVLQELERLEGEKLDAEQHATRLLRMASSLSPASSPLFLQDYLCLCGDCPQYKTIAHDVETLVTWRSRAERQLIARVLQAFSTYNEAIGYDAAMIPMADECLSVWCGDEDQAFKTFVLLHDEIPFLCASAA